MLRPRAVIMKLRGPLVPIPQAVSRKIEIEYSVVMGRQMYWKDIRDGALNQVIFHYYPIHVGPSKQLHTKVLIQIKGYEILKWHNLLGLCCLEVGLTQNLVDPKTLSIDAM